MRSALLLLLLFATTPALAADKVRVQVEGCGALDEHEIERIVALELASVLAEREAPFPPVKVRCEGAFMKIVVNDTVTSKVLERELPAPKPGEPGRERTIALAVSQLFLSSWTELLLPPPAAPVGPPEAASGSKAARVAVAKAVAPPAREVDLSVVGGARAHDLGRPLVLYAAGLRTTIALGSGLRALVRFEGATGSAARDRGDVDVSFVGAGLGLGYRTSGTFAFQGLLDLGASHVRIEGTPSGASTLGSAKSGVTADASLTLGPVLRLGPALLALEARAGVVVPSVVGEVAHEREVRASGLWLGAGLSLGVVFGGAR